MKIHYYHKPGVIIPTDAELRAIQYHFGFDTALILQCRVFTGSTVWEDVDGKRWFTSEKTAKERKTMKKVFWNTELKKWGAE